MNRTTPLTSGMDALTGIKNRGKVSARKEQAESPALNGVRGRKGRPASKERNVRRESNARPDPTDRNIPIVPNILPVRNMPLRNDLPVRKLTGITVSVVFHKSLYVRHPGESRGPEPKTLLDSGFRRNDGKPNVKKCWLHHTNRILFS